MFSVKLKWTVKNTWFVCAFALGMNDLPPSTRVERLSQITFIESPDLEEEAYTSIWSLPQPKKHTWKQTLFKAQPPRRSASLNIGNITAAAAATTTTTRRPTTVSRSMQALDYYPRLQYRQGMRSNQVRNCDCHGLLWFCWAGQTEVLMYEQGLSVSIC